MSFYELLLRSVAPVFLGIVSRSVLFLLQAVTIVVMAPTLPQSPSLNPSSCEATFSLQMPQVREVVTVPITKRERLHGVTAFETTQRALEAFHRDGVVILQDAVSHESLDHIHD